MGAKSILDPQQSISIEKYDVGNRSIQKLSLYFVLTNAGLHKEWAESKSAMTIRRE